MDSCDALVVNGYNSVAFLLVNRGFDVWCGNIRGNQYSLGYVGPLTEAGQWEIDLEDMSHDLKTFTDYVLKNSNYSQLHFIGFGFANSLASIATSMNTTFYQAKWASWTAMQPTMQMIDYKKSPILSLLFDLQIIGGPKFFRETMNIYDFLSPNRLITLMIESFCYMNPTICKTLEQNWIDSDPDLDNSTCVKTYFGHFPAGTPMKGLEHYG